MKDLTKLLIDVFILVGFSIAATSCSMYNHNRVKSNMIEQRIRVTSNQKYTQLLDAGMAPEDVVKFGTIQDEEGRPIGVKAAIDLANVKGIRAYAKTFSEEPLSSTLSLAIDAAVTYYIAEGIKNLKNDRDQSEQQQDVPQSINNIINFDSITTTEGNVNVIQINNFGDVNRK